MRRLLSLHYKSAVCAVCIESYNFAVMAKFKQEKDQILVSDVSV